MTTPERLRRRQRIEGVVIILLALFTVAQTIAINLEDRDQRQCVEEKFGELSVALDARAKLAERETRASQRVWDVYAEAAGLVKDDPTRELTPKQEDRLRTKLVAALLNYQDEVTEVQRQRRENPVPPYPVGACDQ